MSQLILFVDDTWLIKVGNGITGWIPVNKFIYLTNKLMAPVILLLKSFKVLFTQSQNKSSNTSRGMEMSYFCVRARAVGSVLGKAHYQDFVIYIRGNVMSEKDNYFLNEHLP